MSLFLGTVTGALFLAGIANSWIGERYVLRRLVHRRDFAEMFGSSLVVKKAFQVAWHLSTVGLWSTAGLFLVPEALGSFPGPDSLVLDSVVLVMLLIPISGGILGTYWGLLLRSYTGPFANVLPWVAWLFCAALLITLWRAAQ